MARGALLRRSPNPTGVISSYPLLAGIVGPSSVLPPDNPGWRPFVLTPDSTETFALLRPGGTSRTGNVRSALGRWYLGQWHSTALLLPNSVVPPALLAVDRSSSSKLCSPTLTGSKKQKQKQRHKPRNLLTAPCSRRLISIH